MKSSAVRMNRLRKHRGGYLYLVVLMTTLVVGALAATALRLQTDVISMHRAGNDWRKAAELSDSALALAIQRINSTSNWRTTYTNGTASSAITMDAGTMSFSIHDDDDSNLADSATENVRVRGVGVAGNAGTFKVFNCNPVVRVSAA